MIHDEFLREYQKDTLSVNLNWLKNFQLIEITKINILSLAQKIYDPIRIISPVLSSLKHRYKPYGKMNPLGIGAINKTFLTWYNELFILKEISVSRWIHTGSEKRKAVSIHTFCDASSQAYVFVQIQTPSFPEVYLLASKSRIAPVIQITIPRLELIVSTVRSRLCTTSVIDGRI